MSLKLSPSTLCTVLFAGFSFAACGGAQSEPSTASDAAESGPSAEAAASSGECNTGDACLKAAESETGDGKGALLAKALELFGKECSDETPDGLKSCNGAAKLNASSATPDAKPESAKELYAKVCSSEKARARIIELTGSIAESTAVASHMVDQKKLGASQAERDAIQLELGIGCGELGLIYVGEGKPELETVEPLFEGCRYAENKAACDKLPACPSGEERSDSTRGHCCKVGKRWDSEQRACK